MCGIVGVFGTENLFTKLHQAGHKIQHRGSDGTGVVVSDGLQFLLPDTYRVLGSVTESFASWPRIKPEDALLGLLHIRYGTSGNRKSLKNIQPFFVDSPYHGRFALIHNGDTQDVEPLRERLRREHGTRFSSDSDSEVLANLIGYCDALNLSEAIHMALRGVRSAYAIIVATRTSLIAARDPYGYRPLSIGIFPDGGYILASETCSFGIIGAEFVREVAPGEVVVIDKDGLRRAYRSTSAHKPPRLQQCIFEGVYFSDPTSLVFGELGEEACFFRHNLGARLAKEYAERYGKPDKNMLVIPVPDSSNHYAEGFSHHVWHPLTFAVTRTHRSSRSFIGSDQATRDLKVRLKFNFSDELIRGKHCILVDDSLVRGTTIREVIKMLREHGAASVSVLIGSPPILHPCRYGIDFKTRNELLASTMHADTNAMCAFLGADRLVYLSLSGFYEVVEETFGNTGNFCFACFNGTYAL